MMFKRIMSVVLILVTLCSFAAFAEETAATSLASEEINKAATGFTDIAPDASYAEAVKKLVEFGIISGYPDGTFRPYGEVTRAEMCKMINLTLGYTDASGAAGFPDVTSDKWFYQYALAAQKQGYVKGYEDDTFRGSNNITRQEVCTILDRLLKPMNLGLPVVITDEVASWARPHVELIIQNFIMPIEANNTFRATENLKRHELASVLSNMAIGPVKQLDAKVRFFVNGEQYTDTQKVMIGNCAVSPAEPAAVSDAYMFDGWRILGAKDVVDVNSNIITGDIDYEAVFIKKQYEVEFYNGGSLYETQTVEHGKRLSAPENPEKQGFVFKGWSYSEGTEASSIASLSVTEPIKLYAVYKAEDEQNITVSFFVNGDLLEAKTVKKGASPDIPANPAVDGMEFSGWSLTKGGAVINPRSMKVTEDITLYSVLSDALDAEEYTVKFFVDGSLYDVQSICEAEISMLPVSPEKKDYLFKGWARSKGGSPISVSHHGIYADTSFYAIFEKKNSEEVYYDVIFSVDNNHYNYQQIAAGGFASAPVSPSKENNLFVGWSDTSDGNVISPDAYAIYKDTTFYAVFEQSKAVKFGISYMVDDEVYKTSDALANEAPKYVPNPSKEGYVFKGWAKSKHGEVIDLSLERIIYATTYHAIFEEKADKKYYKASFYADDKVYTEIEAAEDELLVLPVNPEKKNFVFLGWSTTKDGKSERVEQLLTEDKTYYAVFREIKYFTVKFMVDTRTYKSVVVAENSKVNVPVVNPKKDNCIFKGWSDEKGGEVISLTSMNITEACEFYAVFESILEHKVSFVVDNAMYDEQNVLDGEAPEIPENPSKDGYKFKGWSTIPDGNVVSVSSLSVTKDTTLYAVFEEKEEKEYYTVTFYVDSKIYASVEVAEDEELEIPSNPSKKGYDFKGWSKSKDGKLVTVEKVVSGDTQYYAVFEEIQEYVVKFVVDNVTKKEVKVVENETTTPPADPEKTGYEFIGWSTEYDGEAVDVEKYEITEDTYFYAVFEKIPVYYTVVFIVDGKKYESVKVLEGDYPELPEDPEIDGYEFSGWSESENGVIIDPERAEIKLDTTYYAVFESIEEDAKLYKVVFWFDREYLTTLEIEEGDTLYEPDIPELEEYATFHGWATYEGAEKDDVVELEDVVVTRHLDFYSVITKNRNSPELMEMLERGYTQLGRIRHGGGLNEQAITIIRDCIGYVIDDANNGEYITSDYVKVNYNRMVSQLLDIVNNQMDSTQRSNFSNLLTNTRNIDKDVQNFLIDYFDIEMTV